MNLLKKVFVFVLACLLVLPNINSVSATSEFDSAKKLSLNTTVTSDIAKKTSKYYKIDLSHSGTYTVDYTFESNKNSKIYVYDKDYNLVRSITSISLNAAGLAKREFDLKLNPGVYYIKITNDDFSAAGKYTFKTTFENANESFSEANKNNNTISNANNINFETEYNGFITMSDSKDFYKFTLNKKTKINIKYNFFFNDGYVYLFDVNGKELWRDVPGNGYHDIDENTGMFSDHYEVELEKGTYYLSLSAVENIYNFENKGKFNFKVVRALPFTDVYEGNWYYGAVANAYYGGLITGATETLFKPNNNMNRGMVAIVFHRMEGAPKVNYSAVFPDVYNNQYYTTAVIWAKQKGVINGYNNGTFMPLKNVTREEMATMIYRFAKYKGVNVKATKDISYFSDYKNITTYAKEPLQWCVEKGIMSGKLNGTKLDPLGNATRAECSKMLVQANQEIY